MFLFSATFYPIDVVSAGAPDLRPAHAAVPGRRSHPVALGRRDHAGPAGPRRVPDGHGTHRAGHHVAPTRRAAAQVARSPAATGMGARRARPRRSSSAGAARGWWSGASRSPARRSPVPRRDVLGPAGAGLRRPGCAGSSSSGWRLRPTAATGPGGSSPATRRATSCGPRSTGSVWPTGPRARRADDGLTLNDAYIAAAVRCAPPLNKPTNDERDTCAPFLAREMALLTELRVIVALGTFGWDAACERLAALGHAVRGRSRGSGTARRRRRAVCPARAYHPANRTRSPAG